ncbi:MAG TPA: four helix bundle protein [Anaerolineales bacterium]|nr:four helix bundle protein [Anaerolineales bacterium]
MTTAKRFEELEVWARARELANMIYDLSDKGTFARDFGLRDQMRRAVISIMSNIAEGFESRTQAQFIEYLGRAKASAGELRSQIYLALDHRYLSQDEFDQVFECAEVTSKQLARFIQYLETQPNARRIREDGVSYDVQP